MVDLQVEFNRIRSSFESDTKRITFHQYQMLRKVDVDILIDSVSDIIDRSILNEIFLMGKSASNIALDIRTIELAFTNAIRPIESRLERTITNAIRPMTNILCELVVEQNNLYGKSALGSDTMSDRGKTFRNNLLESLGFSKKKRKIGYPCMVTEISGDGECVVAAHIAPAHSRVKYLRNIGLTEEDVNSSRNGLLLSKNIEIAFNRLQLSFIRGPIADLTGLPRDGFTMKIWDDDCRDTFIWNGSKKRIGEYDGKQLLLGTHNPLKQVLSYQAYTAFLHFRHVLNVTVSEPSEFGSDNASNYYKNRKLMKDNLLRDVIEEVDHNEGFDNDNTSL